MNLTTAIKMMLWLLVAVILFHLSILLKIVPYELTWGGRLTNDFEMYVFETISVLVNLFLFTLLMIKGNYWKEFIPSEDCRYLLMGFHSPFCSQHPWEYPSKNSL